MKRYLFIVAFHILFSSVQSHAQVTDTAEANIFLLGDDERKMTMLNDNYTVLLMTVSQNNMDLAYEKWMGMLSEMETYSEKIGYDIKGIKLWMNVYWDKTGKIDYIGYYLKPNSRNIKVEELNAFFINFINNYQMKINANSRFYHNGSASFPTHYEFLNEQKAKAKSN